jgi:hypothetical protein
MHRVFQSRDRLQIQRLDVMVPAWVGLKRGGSISDDLIVQSMAVMTSGGLGSGFVIRQQQGHRRARSCDFITLPW